MQKIYLLNVNQICSADDRDSLDKLILSKIDEYRKSVISKSNNPQVKAASECAGLLLMYVAYIAKRGVSDFSINQQIGDGLELLDLNRVLDFIDEPLELEYEFGNQGKPGWIDASLPKFNISHSGDYVAIAVGEKSIGIDIQKMRSKRKLDLAERFFSEKETDLLKSLPEDRQNEMFFRLWSRKEAYGKCTGEGVRPVLDMDFSDLADNSFAEFEWYETSFEDYVLAAVSVK